MRSQYISLENS